MAILILGSMTCGICGLVIEEADGAYSFPAFGENPKDPLSRFSDCSFHEACLLADADGRKAVALDGDRLSKIGPGKRKCQVCGAEIMDPDDYAFIDYVCGPEIHPVAEFNYTHLHKSHVGSWTRKAELISRLEDAWQTEVLPFEVAESILKYIGVAAPESWKAADRPSRSG